MRSNKNLNRLNHKFEGQPILNNPGHNIEKQQSRSNRDRNHGIYGNSNPGRNLNRLNNQFEEQPNHNNQGLSRENLKEGRKRNRKEGRMTKS
jgi:hypothetical protein